MNQGPGQKKLPLPEILIVLVVLSGLFIMRSSRHSYSPASSVQNQLNQVNPQTKTKIEAKLPVLDINTTKTPNKPMVEAQNKKNLGLCRYEDQIKLIHWRVVRHIEKMHPALLALPAYHGACLQKQNSFAVADYDVTNDIGFNYFGDYGVNLVKVGEYSGADIFYQANQKLFKSFGFKSPLEIMEFLNFLGPSNDQIIVYKVSSHGEFKIRTPVAAYSKYPGLQSIEIPDLVNLMKKDSSTQLIDVRPATEKTEVTWGKSTRFPGIDAGTTTSRALADWKQNKEKMKLDLGAPIILFGISESDPNPYLYGTTLHSLGAKKVYVVREGALGKLSFIMRDSIPGVQTLDLQRLSAIIQDSTVIDTRRLATDVHFKPSVHINARTQAFARLDEIQLANIRDQLIAGNLDPRYDISKKNHIQKKLPMIKTKSVIVMGENDFDWIPAYIALNLKNSGRNFEISWFRTGFESLEVYKELGILPNFLNSEVKKSQLGRERVVTKIDPATNKLVRTTTSLPRPAAKPLGPPLKKPVNH